MDGNHSLLLSSLYPTLCADFLTPLILNVIFGLPANVCVIWLILAGPGDKAAEIFSLNLAVCDVAICVSSVILFIAQTTRVSNVVHSTYLWHTVKFTRGFLFSGRPLFMGSICVERYMAIVHPVTFLKYKLLRYRLAGTIICWLTVLVCCMIHLWVSYPTLYSVSLAIAFAWFVVQLFCCVETLRALAQPGPGEGNQASNGMNSAKVKAFRIILVITVFAAVTYLPYFISAVLLYHSLKEESTKLFCINNYFAVLGGFIHPLFYIHRAVKLWHCIEDPV